MRIVLFLLTNLSVVLVFGVILSVTNIDYHSVQVSLITASVFGFCGAFISLIISKWIALQTINGKVITIPRNEIERWLLRIICHHSKKANISMPTVAIYDSTDMNAFATGARRNSSLIAISSCMLNFMNHDEIEAVIAHEISHISNGDMVTMALLQGIVNTFVIFLSRFIAQTISKLIINRNEEQENNNSIIYCSVIMILKTIFGLLASIIILWFSRYREFHADAGAAHLAGRKKMIAALQKFKNNYQSQEEGSSSLLTFYINSKSKSFSKLFMSHPSLDDRIQALRYKKY